jgi:methionine sulfoxide reductase heme-binding subunit
MDISPQFWWYMSRASGIVAFVLLTASLVWGVLLFTRVLKKIDRASWLLEMHSWLSGLAVVTIALHLAALVADNYVHFGWKELFVPNGSTWKTGPVNFGVIAFWILVAVQGTSLVRKHINRKFWKYVHVASYASWWLTAIHAGLAGTDATHRAYQATALLATIAAVAATFIRVISPKKAAASAA